MKPRRFRPAGLSLAGLWRAEGPARLGSREAADLNAVADLCDGAIGPSREIDTRIALAVSPHLRLLASVAPGLWANPDGSRVRAPRYSSLSAAALTLVPDSHSVEFNPRAGGQVEILGPDGRREIGWGRNRHFPLAAAAAALRARAWLASARTQDGRSNEGPIQAGAGVIATAQAGP
ncbi:hypothetical protein GON01_02225 [Sphingomonas sp. MAH-20]|uniref:Uncharacterized protein n=1 Tax=Sphingomonas horti TaxID=2682842 RepID=A0A6I4IXR4_9SPHN|nr:MULTISPECIES: hypothetical protein [Sphingomonas]MBA2920506.1 hypothetical protein [Sphingomonas sp. CGMCC 1.13658]MVO76758.1 hypothetical protein [Sphingomonas horti]